MREADAPSGGKPDRNTGDTMVSGLVGGFPEEKAFRVNLKGRLEVGKTGTMGCVSKCGSKPSWCLPLTALCPLGPVGPVMSL